MTTSHPSSQAADALRRIPSLDALLRRVALAELPRSVAVRVAREYLDEVREAVRASRLDAAAVQRCFGDAAVSDELQRRGRQALAARHRAVINATGVVLHTGIGRAPLADAARRAAQDAGGYAVVELDPRTGQRNEREEAVAAMLCDLTGATGALVVNNNAAATTLVLAAIAAGSEVVVSRGQLVEIGGGFRMPDVMAQAGCQMVEVGTTNRTHLRDFAGAIGERTAALLLVHPSNFLVLGFTAFPAREEIAVLGRERGLCVIDDLGSGLLAREPVPGVGEPRVADVVASGVHLCCFSGDKLMGGPQCGLIVGDRALVARVRAHPLYRAFRCDKLTLAALEATLAIYRDGDPLREIPTLRMLTVSPDHLESRAKTLAGALAPLGATVVPTESFAGSGANPARPLPSFAVAVDGGAAAADALRAPVDGPPIFARVERGQVLLDLRSLELESLDTVAGLVRQRLR